MSANMSRPSLAFLRGLRGMPFKRRIQIGGRRLLQTSPRSFASEEKTFRGQLYESTARRIQAQREAEARFASMKPTSAFAQNSTLTFRMHASAAGMFTADFYSSGFH